MSKDRKTVKDTKKAPAEGGNKKVSSYQNDKASKSDATVPKKK